MEVERNTLTRKEVTAKYNTPKNEYKQREITEDILKPAWSPEVCIPHFVPLLVNHHKKKKVQTVKTKEKTIRKEKREQNQKGGGEEQEEEEVEGEVEKVEEVVDEEVTVGEGDEGEDTFDRKSDRIIRVRKTREEKVTLAHQSKESGEREENGFAPCLSRGAWAGERSSFLLLGPCSWDSVLNLDLDLDLDLESLALVLSFFLSLLLGRTKS